ncbi:hypothetical protein LCGC14_0620670 [marine sediment metagenome]|uniref:Uncharacterized protein n=1 Tax=marine sediment metagenome TaxID=412755 RepID=A0A0F9R9Y3_9ZZZZ
MQYTIEVSGLHAIITVEGEDEEDALYACQEGWGERQIIWDDAEYDVKEDKD